MIKEIMARLRQGKQTMSFPDGPPPALPDHFRGRPLIDVKKCPSGCDVCVSACPTNAISMDPGATIDLGKCIFCPECVEACPEGAITYSDSYQLAAKNRQDLVTGADEKVRVNEAKLEKEILDMFGRSLKLRQVSAGGCNACEADVNVLNTIAWDLGRFGIEFVPSPRHADGLLITGPVTLNMELALKKAYNAIPEPKIVIAVGACAISGGLYWDHDQALGGVSSVLPVDLYIPGCPPHPLTILDGLLRMLNKIKTENCVVSKKY